MWQALSSAIFPAPRELNTGTIAFLPHSSPLSPLCLPGTTHHELHSFAHGCTFTHREAFTNRILCCLPWLKILDKYSQAAPPPCQLLLGPHCLASTLVDTGTFYPLSCIADIHLIVSLHGCHLHQFPIDGEHHCF